MLAVPLEELARVDLLRLGDLAKDGLERRIEAAPLRRLTRELELLLREGDQLVGKFPSAAPRSLIAASTCS